MGAGSIDLVEPAGESDRRKRFDGLYIRPERGSRFTRDREGLATFVGVMHLWPQLREALEQAPIRQARLRRGYPEASGAKLSIWNHRDRTVPPTVQAFRGDTEGDATESFLTRKRL